MKRENVRAWTLCVLVFLSAYLMWACQRVTHVFDPGWPRTFPYPDVLIDVWGRWALSLPQFQHGLFCGCTIRWILLSGVHVALGSSVLLSLVLGKQYILALIPFGAKPGHCRRCKYDVIASLAAFSTHCPECGHPIAPEEVLKKRPDRVSTCSRIATRGLAIACTHWICWSGSLLAIQLTHGYQNDFARAALEVFGFPMLHVYVEASGMWREYMLHVLLISNSLIWGFGIAWVLEKARELHIRLHDRFKRNGQDMVTMCEG